MWHFRVATSGKIKLQWTQLEKREKLGLSKILDELKKQIFFFSHSIFEIGFAVLFYENAISWVTIINFLKYG